MRRSASEALNELESRIARLERRRSKSAAQTVKLSNDRAIIMVEDRQFKDDTINLCFMHMDSSILKKSVSTFMKSLGVYPYAHIVEEYFVTSKCESCICITVKIADPSFWGEDLVEGSGLNWINETILNLPNSIPMR